MEVSRNEEIKFVKCGEAVSPEGREIDAFILTPLVGLPSGKLTGLREWDLPRCLPLHFPASL